MNDDNVSVSQDDGHHRFVVSLDGERAGFTAYVDSADSERVFYHTEVDDAFSGKGLASPLVRQALDDSIEQGFTIVPVCPYVKKWLTKHDGYDANVVKARPEHLRLLPGRNEN